MKRLSQITDRLMGQPMFKLLAKMQELERAGQKIYHFEIGDSDFKAHHHIVEATKKALDDDKTHYVDSMGIKELREAVCDYTEQTLNFKPDLDQVLIMPANGIIDCVMRCVADPGDEVIFPDPSFSTYHSVAHYLGVHGVRVSLKEENQFHMDISEIEKKITNKTKLLIVTSPQNPTGSVLSQKEVKEIACLAEKYDLFILSDEIYSRVVYDCKHYSPSFLDLCRERTIILNGFTKGFSMPGWRLGYAIGPKPLIQKMGLLFQTIYSCASPFVQYGAIEALRGNQDVIEERIQKFKLLRNLVVSKLNEIPGISCTRPDGAYYVFPNITQTGLTSEQFSDFVLEKAGVALLPGPYFGKSGEGFVRLCFTRKAEMIEEACNKIKIAVEEELLCKV